MSKKITAKSPGIEIELIHMEEHDSPRDQLEDPETVQWVEDQIASGNEWAWFTARVKVTYKGILEADDYLGGCSYKSKQDFMKDGYYKDMVDTCISEINEKLKKLGR
jgi:hypothetical protein